ncbi:MAG TPA: hypothetical protein VEZ20_13255 [Allosphingosinicella sp.]|jgi:hypothetical protein|nr:hypothetical protein [Allosphingosinicella sp.]
MSGPGKEPRSHAMTAALLGGAVGAAAAVGAAGVWSARAIARRNGAAQGCEGMNAVMKTAATACELSHGTAASDEARRTRVGED